MNQKTEQNTQSLHNSGRLPFRPFRPKNLRVTTAGLDDSWPEWPVKFPAKTKGNMVVSFEPSPCGHKTPAQSGRGKNELEKFKPAGPCPLDEQSFHFLKSRMYSGHCPAGNEELFEFALSPSPLGRALRSMRPRLVFRIDERHAPRHTPHVPPLTADPPLRPRRRRARPAPGRHAAACAPRAAQHDHTQPHGRMNP